MSQQHWGQPTQQPSQPQPAQPKARRGAAIAIIAAAILIATALIITVILLTTRTTPTPTPTSPAPVSPATSTTPQATPSQAFQRIDETNAPPNVNGWTIGNSLGTSVLLYNPPGSGEISDSFITVDNSATMDTKLGDWKARTKNPTTEIAGRAICGINAEEAGLKACYLETNTFGVLFVFTYSEKNTMETVIDFTTDLAAELP